jgi:hypothetical protein
LKIWLFIFLGLDDRVGNILRWLYGHIVWNIW